ncbi:MAG: sulfotransferase family protein [Clostridia bacterium]|nr:sulfotransferase family protein [Clostridia bacterium]
MNENMVILDHLIQYRSPHYNKEFPLILFWSEKSGCTTFLKWFFFQIGILEKVMEYDPWVHKYEFEVYKKQNSYKEEMREQILHSKKDIFKLVRNPYKRAVSSFLALVFAIYWENQGTGLYREVEKINELFHNNKNSKKGISFKQFLYYIKDVGSDVEKIDSHIARQYLEGEELFIKDYIHLENFSDDISKIEEKYQLKKCHPSAIAESDHHSAPRMNIIGDYSETVITNENISQRSLPTYESFYDKEAVELVKEVFKKDVELYGYDPLQQ